MLDEVQGSIQRHFFELFINDYEQLVLTQDYGHESFFRYKVCKDRVMRFLDKPLTQSVKSRKKVAQAKEIALLAQQLGVAL